MKCVVLRITKFLGRRWDDVKKHLVYFDVVVTVMDIDALWGSKAARQ